MEIEIGAKVTYRTVGLWDFRGTLISIGRTLHGGDCVVQWTYPNKVLSEECLDNLQLIAVLRLDTHGGRLGPQKEKTMTLGDIKKAQNIVFHQSFSVHYEIADQQSNAHCALEGCGRKLSMCSSAGATVDSHPVCCYCLEEALTWQQITTIRNTQHKKEAGKTYAQIQAMYLIP